MSFSLLKRWFSCWIIVSDFLVPRVNKCLFCAARLNGVLIPGVTVRHSRFRRQLSVRIQRPFECRPSSGINSARQKSPRFLLSFLLSLTRRYFISFPLHDTRRRRAPYSGQAFRLPTSTLPGTRHREQTLFSGLGISSNVSPVIIWSVAFPV